MILLCIYPSFIVLASTEYIVPLKAILVAIAAILSIFELVLAVFSALVARIKQINCLICLVIFE
jgi:hypothetical protein